MMEPKKTNKKPFWLSIKHLCISVLANMHVSFPLIRKHVHIITYKLYCQILCKTAIKTNHFKKKFSTLGKPSPEKVLRVHPKHANVCTNGL